VTKKNQSSSSSTKTNCISCITRIKIIISKVRC